MNKSAAPDLDVAESFGVATRHIPTVFIISAPSGSGKSTLVSRLMASDNGLRFSVSYTTRKPRGLEKPGESYMYITHDEFRRRVEEGEFLEHAEVFGNLYGTHREVLEQAAAEGKDLVLDIDVKGARQLKDRIPEAVTIFILPPSRDILEQRLRSRSEDSEAVIQRRLEEAAEELRNHKQYDYVLVNHQLEESSGTLAAIVRAERNRRVRMEERIGPILKSFEERPPSLFDAENRRR